MKIELFFCEKSNYDNLIGKTFEVEIVEEVSPLTISIITAFRWDVVVWIFSVEWFWYWWMGMLIY